MTTNPLLHRSLDTVVAARVKEREYQILGGFWKQADRAFAVLLVAQWLAGISLALWLTPYTWAGTARGVHLHLWAAIFLGGFIALPAAALAWLHQGRGQLFRHAIAVAQMFASALLIHLSGGRIETHFHIFGSLAFLAFYRDWRVLITASSVVVIDHYLRGVYWPESVFGTPVGGGLRWLEHAGWVVFEDIVLCYTCIRSRNLIKDFARNSVLVEMGAEQIEIAVAERTRELAESNARLEANIEVRLKTERELKTAKEAADAANRAKSEFLANMSHEIRTPMNGVMGMTSLLLDTPLSEQQQNFTETIRQSCDALLVVINDILDFSKIESGKLEMEEQTFDVRSCIEDTLDLFSPKAAEKHLDLGYLLCEDVPSHVVGDPTRIRQVLVNLVGNALKFTEKGSVLVKVKAERLERAPVRSSSAPEQFCLLQIEVRDTGIGISAEAQQKLFKQFSQVDTSMTRRYGGTGLGLVISRRLAEIMGGTIRVESEPGKGSTFIFTARVRVATTSPAAPSLPLLQGKHLLIVDDGDVNRRILHVQSERWGMACSEVNSGKDALAWLEAGNHTDVAILDLQMPDMDGLELAERIHALPRCRDLPLILLSSAGHLRERDDNRWLHFCARFTKPVKLVPLRDALLTSLGHREEVARKSRPVQATTKLAEQVPLRILLAEDNVVNQRVALRFLEQLGYRCDLASNGAEAVEAVRRQPYDVLLLDVQMPEMDGFEVTAHLRSQPQPHDVPQIVALTAHATAQDREICLSAGMDDYLTKPISLPLLEQKLRDAGSRLAAVRAASSSVQPGN